MHPILFELNNQNRPERRGGDAIGFSVEMFHETAATGAAECYSLLASPGNVSCTKNHGWRNVLPARVLKQKIDSSSRLTTALSKSIQSARAVVVCTDSLKKSRKR
jgi:hypothetical protein